MQDDPRSDKRKFGVFWKTKEGMHGMVYDSFTAAESGAKHVGASQIVAILLVDDHEDSNCVIPYAKTLFAVELPFDYQAFVNEAIKSDPEINQLDKDDVA